ncbi:hypothetical protein [Nostoc phage YongM]|nr:hypothetical protein [Nostoc phage YongM]
MKNNKESQPFVNSEYSVELVSGCWYNAVIDEKFNIVYRLRFYSITMTETRSLVYLFFDEEETAHFLNTDEIRQYKLKSF